MRNNLFLVFRVPFFDPLGADVMDAIRERDAFTQVPARGLAELTGAPVDKLGKIVHRIPTQGNLIRFAVGVHSFGFGPILRVNAARNTLRCVWNASAEEAAAPLPVQQRRRRRVIDKFGR